MKTRFKFYDVKAKLFLQALLLVFLSITTFSCGDPCSNGACSKNGYCEEGVCICLTGYEGVACEIEKRNKFLGIWKATDFDCDILSSSKLNLTIEKGSLIREVEVKFENGFDLHLTGKIFGNTINIPFQDFTNSYQGNLVLIGDQLVMKLIINTNGEGGICDLTAIRE